MQGFLFFRPMPPEDLTNLFHQGWQSNRCNGLLRKHDLAPIPTSRDFRFGHPDTVRVLPSAARMQDLGSPLTVDAPFAPDSVAECRFIAAFQLAGGLFADTAP